MSNVIDILKARGLFDDATTPDIGQKVEKPVTVYAGFDPTSSSLQVGNFVTIMVMAHFQRCGHKVIGLVGGATGMIGDPSGQSSERNLLTHDQVVENQEGIRENLSRFLDFDHPTAPARLVNNMDWIGRISYIDFLRDVGKHFRMGIMLSKESVKKRLEGDAGMSYTEFSYQLLQAYDFLHLYDTAGCTIQVGGSDQWGNITAGTDLVRKLRGVETHGMTFPLVCDSTGAKFGKSAGNAVYLDHRRTSYYDFYQFFYRVADADVIRFLKVFTFLPLEEIAELDQQLKSAPEKRGAQTRLAEEMTRTVHGEKGLRVAQRASSVLFGESIEGLNAEDLLGVFANVPSTELPRAKVVDVSIVDLAAACELCKSKGEARRLVEKGGLYVNNGRVESVEAKVKASDVVDGRVLVLRSGKKTFRLVKLV